jgi:hypothetical protein
LERYFLEPYRFIPPFRSTFWCRIAAAFLRRHLRIKHGIHQYHVEGADRLIASVKAGAGVMLTPNHTRWADPLVLGSVAARLGHYLYYMASYHLFKQSRVRGWMLRRLGGFSVWREGPDREAIKAAVQILADAERPLTLFPEGTWMRQNDRIVPLQEGLSLILRQAMKQSERPLMVHPVGIKYWMLEDPVPALSDRLAELERALGWAAQDRLGPVARIEKLGTALVGIREVEYLSSTQPGTLDERMDRLIDSQVSRLERQHMSRTHEGWHLERIRRLRQHLMRRLIEEKDDQLRVAAIRHDLSVLLLCENLAGHSLAYVQEKPTPERLVETLQRIEETVTDQAERPVVPMGVVIHIAPAIDARKLLGAGRERGAGDPLVAMLRPTMQTLIDGLNAQGPPPAWNCPSPTHPPAPVAFPTATVPH